MSSFAGNTLLISPEVLLKEGLLAEEQVRPLRVLPTARVDYSLVCARKDVMLRKAFERFCERGDGEFEGFCSENSWWLEDYALFKALRDASGKPWYVWSAVLRDRDREALTRKRLSLKAAVEREKFSQFVFAKQWRELRKHCMMRSVEIIGDMPFYVCYDGADVWTRPELFCLDAEKKPKFVGGAPPDYFSRKGQLWGNPVYDWKAMEGAGFDFWMARIMHSLKAFDVLRLDHFRGFVAYWRVPFPARDARKGRWLRVPSGAFFGRLRSVVPSLPFVAEDLGLITDAVRKCVRSLGVPGMRVLLFAFDGSRRNPHLPENHVENCVVFTGTHDTNTVRGWFADEATAKQRKALFKYLGKTVSEKPVSREFVRLALASKANLSIVPLQDVLGLGSEARMNKPATRRGNWEWRLTLDEMASEKMKEFGEMTVEFDRACSVS
jgi:4-alpha-glucanotransferase